MQKIARLRKIICAEVKKDITGLSMEFHLLSK